MDRDLHLAPTGDRSGGIGRGGGDDGIRGHARGNGSCDGDGDGSSVGGGKGGDATEKGSTNIMRNGRKGVRKKTTLPNTLHNHVSHS